jgi:hypothetical protein
MDVLCDTKTSKNIDKFVCKVCDFSCCKKGDWNRHIVRPKHINLTLSNTCDKKTSYTCNICDKIYFSRNGLWNHKKTCSESVVIDKPTEHKETTDKDLIMLLINDNKEFKQLVIELCKEKDELKTMMIEQQNILLEVCKNGTNNNHTNSHNKAFNLNFFLNETCKDAMNITDFVESIKLQLTDLERVGELGYVEGISNIITSKLKALDVTQRPVHCTDKKRETMYVKDENTWEKDEEKKKMHKLVKKVADKNMRLLPEYREKYPDYIKASSLCSDKYNQMFLESFGGSGDNNYEKEEKIIQKVSREVFVDKAV